MRTALMSLGALAALMLGGERAEARDFNGVDGYVGHAGRWFTDQEGRTMSFRGLVLPLRKAPYSLDVQGVDDDDAAWLARNGFNLMQVRFTYGAIEPRPGDYDEAYIDRVVRMVKRFTSRGVRVLLHSDQGNWGPVTHGRGFPDWATFTDGAPNPDLGFGPNHLANEAVQRAFDNFWDNRATARGEGLQEGYAKGIGELARRLADDPLVLGLDILNEPWLGTRWPTCFPMGRSAAGFADGACAAFDREVLAPFYAKVIPMLRPQMPRQLLFYEPVPTFDLGFRTYLDGVGVADRGIGFAFHPYCGADGGGANIPPIPAGELKEEHCASEESKVLGLAIEHVSRTGDALLSNEFGATSFARTFERLLSLHERHLVPWTITAWCCRDFTGAPSGDVILDPRKPPTDDNLDQGKVKALVRPYPAALSGVPTGARFDPTSRHYVLGFSTERADRAGRFGAGARSVVHVPERPYPHGYRIARLTGARIASAPDAEQLELLADAGAHAIDLEVRPRAAGEAASLCRDVVPPRIRLLRKVRVTRRAARLTGRTADRGCTGIVGAFGRPPAVSRPRVVIRRRAGSGCRFLRRDGLLSRVRPCARPIGLRAEGRRRWSLTQSVRLPAGMYALEVTARDGARNTRTLQRRLMVR